MASAPHYSNINQMPAHEKPAPVTYTREELDAMRDEEARGVVPRGFLADLKERIDKAVFGHDFKRDSRNRPIEQGLGSPGHETSQHYAALLRNEMLGVEPKGAYRRAVTDQWRRDPQKAEALHLPRPEALPAAVAGDE